MCVLQSENNILEIYLCRIFVFSRYDLMYPKLDAHFLGVWPWASGPLLLSPEWMDDRQLSPFLVYVVLGIKLKDSYMPDVNSTNWVTPLALGLKFIRHLFLKPHEFNFFISHQPAKKSPAGQNNDGT